MVTKTTSVIRAPQQEGSGVWISLLSITQRDGLWQSVFVTFYVLELLKGVHRGKKRRFAELLYIRIKRVYSACEGISTVTLLSRLQVQQLYPCFISPCIILQFGSWTCSISPWRFRKISFQMFWKISAKTLITKETFSTKIWWKAHKSQYKTGNTPHKQMLFVHYLLVDPFEKQASDIYFVTSVLRRIFSYTSNRK